MDLPKRKPLRLKGHDYSSEGSYFLTICTHNRKCLFSNIKMAQDITPDSSVLGRDHYDEPDFLLTYYGKIVENVISDIPTRFNICVDTYVIMPNHIHMIISIMDSDVDENAKRSLISKMIGYFKMNVSKTIRKSGYTDVIWQRGYNDHVIRNEKDYINTWNYIADNRLKWAFDSYYTERKGDNNV